MRHSYFAESTGICEDQANATQCHRKKLKFEEKNMQSSEVVLGLNFEWLEWWKYLKKVAMKATFTYNDLNNTKSTPHAIDNLWPNFRVNICHVTKLKMWFEFGQSSRLGSATTTPTPHPPTPHPRLEHNWGQLQVDACRRKRVIFMQK